MGVGLEPGARAMGGKEGVVEDGAPEEGEVGGGRVEAAGSGCH